MNYLLATLLLHNLASAYQISYLNGQNVVANGMVVNASDQTAYISGTTTASAFGQFHYGKQDALLIKISLLNASLIWARQIGGPEIEVAGVELASVIPTGRQAKGIALIPLSQQVAIAFSSSSDSIQNQVFKPPGVEAYSVVALYFPNGSLITLVSNFPLPSGHLWKYQVQIDLAASIDSLFLELYLESDTNSEQPAALVCIKSNLSMQLINVLPSAVGRGLQVYDEKLIRVGVTFDPIFGPITEPGGEAFAAVYLTSNFSLVRASQFGVIGSQTVLQNSMYLPTIESYLLVGYRYSYSVGNFYKMACIQWLQNGSFVTLINIGSSTGYESFTSVSIQPNSNNLILSGYLSGANLVYGGDFDAAVFIYSPNLTLLSRYVIGGPSSDSGSVINYPYVLISQYGNDSNGNSGPAILTLDTPEALVTASSTTPDYLSVNTQRQSLSLTNLSPTDTNYVYQTTTVSSLGLTSSFLRSSSSQVEHGGVTQYPSQSETIALLFTQNSVFVYKSSQNSLSSLGDFGLVTNSTDTSFLFIVIVSGAVAAGVLLVMVICYCTVFRRKNNRQLTKNSSLQNFDSEQIAGTTVMAGTTSVIGTNYPNQTTLLPDVKEIATPGFLSMQDGLNVRYPDLPVIARGGGGSIVHAEILAFPAQHPSRGSSVSRCVAKLVQNTKQDNFQQEVALMWHFKGNSCIVPVLGYIMSPMTLLMPFYECGSLSDVIQNSQALWTFKTPMILACDVVSAIVTLHKSGVVHNDIKSQNYLVELRDGNELHALLTDFGICSISSSANTVTGQVWNGLYGRSLKYAAPEVLTANINNSSQTPLEHMHKRDVYSAALILNELVTRSMAWSNVRANQIQQLVLNGQRPPLQPVKCVDSRISNYQEIVQQAWRQSPDARIDSTQLLDMLKKLI